LAIFANMLNSDSFHVEEIKPKEKNDEQKQKKEE
jgi:hypothetical protein